MIPELEIIMSFLPLGTSICLHTKLYENTITSLDQNCNNALHIIYVMD
jgi:hypothetical protein